MPGLLYFQKINWSSIKVHLKVSKKVKGLEEPSSHLVAANEMSTGQKNDPYFVIHANLAGSLLFQTTILLL
jgi:hypothetical protein